MVQLLKMCTSAGSSTCPVEAVGAVYSNVLSAPGVPISRLPHELVHVLRGRDLPVPATPNLQPQSDEVCEARRENLGLSIWLAASHRHVSAFSKGRTCV
jgi:hypothetical protein